MNCHACAQYSSTVKRVQTSTAGLPASHAYSMVYRLSTWQTYLPQSVKADVWCAVFGRITNKVTKVEGLQIGQLVKFHKDCIADMADDDDSDSD